MTCWCKRCKANKTTFLLIQSRKMYIFGLCNQFYAGNGTAEPSSSTWASPCLTMPKTDNTPCFCLDFRKVRTKPDSYPSPRTDDCHQPGWCCWVHLQIQAFERLHLSNRQQQQHSNAWWINLLGIWKAVQCIQRTLSSSVVAVLLLSCVSVLSFTVAGSWLVVAGGS